MSRPALTNIQLQMSSTGLTLSSTDVIWLYKGNSLITRVLGSTTLTVQDLLDGNVCIPYTEVDNNTSIITVVDALTNGNCVRVEVNIQAVAAPTATPTPTPTPTLAIPTRTPTPTPTPTAQPGWYFTASNYNSHLDASCATVTVGPYYFVPNDNTPEQGPVNGSRVYTNSQLTDYLIGYGRYYGASRFTSSSPSTIVAIGNTGYVFNISTPEC